MIGQFFGEEILKRLVKTGGTTLQLQAGSRFRVGGLGVRLDSGLNLDLGVNGIGGLDVGLIAASRIYMVYAVNIGGTVFLIASLSPNSIGPSGHTSWKLVGAVLTTYNAQIGSTVNISGVPTSEVFENGPLIIDAVTTAPTKGTIVRDRISQRMVGSITELHYEFEQSSAGTGGSGSYLYKMPNGLLVDLTHITESVIGINSKIGSGHIANTSDGISSNARDTILGMYDSSSFVSASDIQPSDSLNLHSSTDFILTGALIRISGNLSVPIIGWSDIPLKDL